MGKQKNIYVTDEGEWENIISRSKPYSVFKYLLRLEDKVEKYNRLLQMINKGILAVNPKKAKEEDIEWLTSLS
jgi:hypothetical protein